MAITIKQKAENLAKEHGIEIWQPKENDYKTFQINLPEGWILYGQTGLSLHLDPSVSNYQQWKEILEDIQVLVSQKEFWQKISEVEENQVIEPETKTIDELVAELKATKKQRIKADN